MYVSQRTRRASSARQSRIDSYTTQARRSLIAFCLGLVAVTVALVAAVIPQRPAWADDTATPTTSTTSTSLNDFTDAVTIDGKDALSGSEITIRAEAEPTVKIHFTENDHGLQFDMGQALTYTFPSQFHVSDHEATNINIIVKYVDENSIQHNVTIAGNSYTVSSDGTVTFNWNKSDPNFSHLVEASNAEFTLTFNGNFTGSSDSVQWGNDKTSKITVDNSDGVTVSKYGSYQSSDGKIHYTVTATAKGAPTGVNIVDTVGGTALKSDTFTIVSVSSTTGSRNYEASSLTRSDDTFTYALGNMTNGEVVTITYTVDVDYSALSGTATYDQTKNEIGANWEGGSESPKTISLENGISYTSMKKEAGIASYSGTNNTTATIPWTVTYNSEMIAAMAGGTIKDSINEGTGLATMNYSGDVTITVKNSSGTTVRTDTRTPSGKSFTYDIPERDTEPYTYIVTYNTTVNLTGAVAAQTVSNTVTDGKDHSATETAEVEPATSVSPAKTVTNTAEDAIDTGKISYQITFDVPEEGLSQASVYDELPGMYIEDWRLDTLDADSLVVTVSDGTTTTTLTQDGTGAHYTLTGGEVTTSDPHHKTFTLEFYQDDSTTGFAAGSARTVTITYTTSIDSEWLTRHKNETITQDYQKIHTNTATVTANNIQLKPVTAQLIPVKSSLTKTASNSGKPITWITDSTTGKKLPVWEFCITMTGNMEPTTVTDTFDTSVFRLLTPDDLSGVWDVDVHRSYNLQNGNGRYNYDHYLETYGQTLTGASFTITADEITQARTYTTPHYTGNTFQIYYFLTFASTDALDEENTAAATDAKTYTNGATWGSLTSSADFSYQYVPIDKTADTFRSSVTLDDGRTLYNVILYTLSVNPSALTVGTGTTIEVVDELSDNQSIIYDTISVSPSENATWDVSGHNITFHVPNSQATTITYYARVNKMGGQTVSNTATVNGQSSKITQSMTVEAAGDGSASVPSITILKHASGSMSTRLEGARFGLYATQQDATDRTNALGYYTTNANGLASISHFTDENGVSRTGEGSTLIFNTTYYLQELDAPDGYALDSTTYIFQIDKNEANYTASPRVYYNGDYLRISNTAATGNLTVTKTFAGALGASGLTEDQQKAITFTVTGPNSFSDSFTLYDLLTDTAGTVGKYTDIPTGTYTVTETIDSAGEVPGYSCETTYAVSAGSTSSSAATATVSKDTTTTVTVTNTYTRDTGTLTVSKLFGTGSALDGTMLSEGKQHAITFTVTGPSGSESTTRTFTLYELLHGTAGSYTNLPTGEYTITETNAGVDNYTLDTTYAVTEGTGRGDSSSATVTVAKNTASAATVTNTYTRDTGNLVIKKEFGATSAITSASTEASSISFTVTGPDGFTAQTFTYADMQSGEKSFSGVPTGSYTVTETNAIAGYSVTTTYAVDTNGTAGASGTAATATASVVTDQMTTITLTNTYTKNERNEVVHDAVTVHKTTDDSRRLVGATFTLYDTQGNPSGRSWSTTFVTKAEGAADATEAAFTIRTSDSRLAGKLPTAGSSVTYYLQETAVPSGSGYTLNSTEYTVVISATASTELVGDVFVTTTTYDIAINGADSVTVQNNRDTTNDVETHASVTFTKLGSDTGVGLPDATYNLYTTSNPSDTDAALATYTSDSHGQFDVATVSVSTTDSELHNYLVNSGTTFPATLYLVETGAPTGYAVDATPITIVVNREVRTVDSPSPHKETIYSMTVNGSAVTAQTVTDRREMGYVSVSKTLAGVDATGLSEDQQRAITFELRNSSGAAVKSFTYYDIASASGSYAFEVEVPTGDYTLVETSAAVSGYRLTGTTYAVGTSGTSQDVCETITVSTSNTSSNPATVAVTNTYERETGSITVTKALAGVVGTLTEAQRRAITFELRDSSGVSVRRFTYDDVYAAEHAGGSYTITDLPTGAYTLVETASAVDNHTLSSTTYAVSGGAAATACDPITVSTTSTPTVAVRNTYTRDRGTLTVTKTATGDLTSLAGLTDAQKAGISFRITGPDSYDQTFTYANMDASGVLRLTNMPTGTYTVTETVATAGEVAGYTYVTTYDVSGTATQEVAVTTGGTASITVTNTYTRERGSLVLSKGVNGYDYSTLTDEQKAGITFHVTGPDGYDQTFTYAQMTGDTLTIPDLPTGTYTVQEVILSDGTISGYSCTTSYLVDGAATRRASVTTSGTPTVAITNTYSRATGSLTITKTIAGDLAAGDLTDEQQEAMLFTLTGPSGFSRTVSYKDIVDAGGAYTFTGLVLGEYTLSEVGAAVDGYDLRSVVYQVDDVETNVAVVSESLTPTIDVTNTYERQVEHGTLVVQKTFAGDLGADDLTDAQKAGISFAVTGPDGYSVSFSYADMTNDTQTLTDLVPGTYTVTETVSALGAVAGYALTTTYQVGSTETSSATVEANATATVEVTNTYTRREDTDETHGSVTLVKTGEDGTLLSGATFTLYADAACAQAVATYTTSDAGTLVISSADAALADLLPTATAAGATTTLYLRETAAPEGYELDDATHELLVKAVLSETLDNTQNAFVTTTAYTLTLDGLSTLAVVDEKTPEEETPVTPEEETPVTPTPTPTPERPAPHGAIPRSGDVLASSAPALLGAASVALVAVALWLRRKKR